MADERHTAGGMRFKASVDVVESMGSEHYAYFDVEAEAHQSDDLAELAEDAGQRASRRRYRRRRDARRRAAVPDSSAAAGHDVELVLDTSQIKLFDPDGGRSLTPRQTEIPCHDRGVVSPQTAGAVLGTHGVGAQPRDAAARVPAHRDRRRGGPARRDDRRARLGQRRRVLLRRASGRRRCRSTSATRASTLDLRDWVNSGLMTFFFFVVGLEARREFDLGELRERRRFALPLLAGDRRDGGAGRDLPGVQRGRGRRRTAGASRCRPTRRSRSACSRSSGRASRTACARSCSRSPWSTTSLALVVIAIVYTEEVDVSALLVAVALFGAILVAARRPACGTGLSTWCSARRPGSRCSSRASTRSSSASRWAC